MVKKEGKFFIIGIIFLLLFPSVLAEFSLFGPKTPPGQAPGILCAPTGCRFIGNATLDGNSIANGYVFNVTIQGATILNATFQQIAFINATEIQGEYWVDEAGDTMSGTLNMDGNDIINIQYITSADWSNVTITNSQIIDYFMWMLNESDLLNQSGTIGINYNTLDSKYLNLEDYGTGVIISGGYIYLDLDFLNNTIDSRVTDPGNDYWVDEAGDTMYGDLNMSNNSILDVWQLKVHNITGFSPVYISNDVIVSEDVIADNFFGQFQGIFTGNGSIGNVSIVNAGIDHLTVNNDTDLNGPVNISGNVDMNFYNISNVDTIRASYYGSNSPIVFVDEFGDPLMTLSNTETVNGSLPYIGDIVAETITVERLIISGLLNYSNTEPPDVWDSDEEWINEINYTFYFNEDTLAAYLTNATNISVDILDVENLSVNNLEAISAFITYLGATTGVIVNFNSTNADITNLVSENIIVNNLTAVNANINGLVINNGTVDSLNANSITVSGNITPNQNNTYSIGSPDFVWASIYADTFFGNLDWSYLTSVPQIKWWTDQSQYLYNDSQYIYFNETKMNDTVENRFALREENITITVSSGQGSAVTSNCCYPSAEILQVAVFPTTPTNNYRFEAYGTLSEDIVDTDRIPHTGDWLIGHRGVVLYGETMSLNITNANIDEQFTVRIRWRP